MSETSQQNRPGYAEIRAASKLHPDSGAWAFFMREVVKLPHEMSQAVFQVIRLERWKDAPHPLEAIRLDAIEAHERAWAGSGFSASKSLTAVQKSW